jgi:hypothetical protein
MHHHTRLTVESTFLLSIFLGAVQKAVITLLFEEETEAQRDVACSKDPVSWKDF